MKERNLALFDIDKTIYEGYTIFPLAESQLKNGLINQSCLDDLYNDLKLLKDGNTTYEETVANLCIHWAEGLKGINYSDVLQNAEDFFKFDDKFYPYFKKIKSQLINTFDIYLITGEPQFIAKSIVNKFAVTGYVSAEFEVINNVFTGKVKRFLAKRSEKQEAIQNALTKYKKGNSFAFGDSEGDIEMLEAVQHPICVNASPGLQKVAIDKGWSIKKPEDVEVFVMTLLNNKKNVN